MSEKKQLHLTVDYDVWFHFRNKNINVSGLVNDVLKASVNLEKQNIGIKELREKIELENKEIKEKELNRNNLIMELSLAQVHEKEKQKRDFDQAVMQGKSLKIANPLRYL